MRVSHPGCLFLLLAACSPPEPDPCDTRSPILLAHDANPRFRVDIVGGYTFVAFEGIWVHDRDHHLHVGEACGADAREIAVGLDVAPVRLHPDDPDADDPALACDRFDRQLFRIDLDGLLLPELMLPRLDCTSLVATPHGPVLAERDRHAFWHLPQFPDETDARELSADGFNQRLVWHADRLLYLAQDGLHRRDLVTDADDLLIADIVMPDYQLTATHVLWHSFAVPTMQLRDLATGEDHPLGPYRFPEDDQARDESTPGWRFEPDGNHVLHLPDAPDEPMTAHDLAGNLVPFPAVGTRVAYPAAGGVVLAIDADVRLAVPGDPVGTDLDIPDGANLDDLQAVGDHLEARVDRDLYAVPLDGGPATLLVRGATAARTRIDDRLLITLADGYLAVVHQPSSTSHFLASGVQRYTYLPGHGIYYSVDAGDDGARGGLWLLTDAAIAARFTGCKEMCQ